MNTLDGEVTFEHVLAPGHLAHLGRVIHVQCNGVRTGHSWLAASVADLDGSNGMALDLGAGTCLDAEQAGRLGALARELMAQQGERDVREST